MNEVWRDIPGYEGAYQASNLGRVRSLDRLVPYISKLGNLSHKSLKGKVLRPAQNRTTRYWSAQLGRANHIMLHRIIALTFIENPSGLPEVNHKDGNRSNNSCENLEWVTSSDNKFHSYRELGRKQHMWTTGVMLVNENEKITFPSQLAAAKHLGVAAASIRSAYDKGHLCRGYKVIAQ